MKRISLLLGITVFGMGAWAQPAEGEPTTFERVIQMEAALSSPDGGLLYSGEWDDIIEDARNTGNRELEIRARSAVAGLRLRQRRSLPSDAGQYLQEAWDRESERRSSDFNNSLAGIGSAVSLGVFVVGTTAASGGLVLGDQFWKEFVTSAPGSQQARDAYARMAVSDYVSFFGSLTAITGAIGFVVFELIKD